MGLITGPISSLYGGVSQQSETLRKDNQMEVMANAHATVVDGLMKRPHTDFIALLTSLAENGALIHGINRDENEKYIVVVTGETSEPIEVYTVEGVKCTVQYGYLDDSLNYTADPLPKNYVTSTDTTTPNAQWRMTTVADYTFVVNTKIIADFTTDTVSGSIAGTVQTFSDLPTSPTQGQLYEITGGDVDQFQGYYVEYDGSAWVETIKPGLKYKLDQNLMPHRLVRTGTNLFTFAPCNWSNRRVGDDDTQVYPSFILRNINNIFFYRNRLGLLSGDSVYLSRTAKYFDLFIKTALDVLDDDPIDKSAASTQVTTLRTVTTFDKDLLVFSDEQQFHFGSNGSAILSPKTAAFTPTTHYLIERTSNPVAAGPNVYFACPKKQYTAIREYLVTPDTLLEDAADVTAHVPEYIPNGHIQLAACSSLDVLFVHSDADPSTVYVYKYMWSGTEKAQSAWYKWTFDGDILALVVTDSTLYMIVKRNEIALEKVELEKIKTGSLDFRVHLDQQTGAEGTYTGVDTRFTLPYTPVISDGQIGGIDENTVLCIQSDNPHKIGTPTGGNDGFTKLLIHSDYSTASEVVVDSSPEGHIVPDGLIGQKWWNDPTRAKFGASSLKFESSWNLAFGDSSDFTIGGGDCTIEMWVYLTQNMNATLGMWDDTSGGFAYGCWGFGAPEYSYTRRFWFGIDAKRSELMMTYSNSGYDTIKLKADDKIPLNQWVHLCFIKQGQTWAILQDGVVQAINHSYAFPLDLWAGQAIYMGDGYNQTNDVWTDEWRFSSIARYNVAAAWEGLQVFVPMEYAYDHTPIIPDKTFTDSSQYEQVVAATDGAVHDETKYKFGRTSITLDGDNDALSVTNSSRFNFGSDPFTVDFWMNPDGTATCTLMEYGSGTDVSWRISYDGSTLIFSYSPDGTNYYGLSWNHSLQTNTWAHMAFVRNGDVMTFYADGVSKGQRVLNEALHASSGSLTIGTDSTGGADYDGCFEEIRISNIARWTKPFFKPWGSYTVYVPDGDDAGTYDGVNGGAPDGFVLDEDHPEFTGEPMLNWFGMRMIDPVTGLDVTDARLNGTEVIVDGDLESEGKTYIFGKAYKMKAQLSTPYLKDSQGNSVVTGRLQLRNLTIAHKSTGYYEFHVTPKGRPTKVHRYTAASLGEAMLNAANILTGTEKWAVYTNARGSKMEIVSRSYLPVELQSGAYQAMFHSKARIG